MYTMVKLGQMVLKGVNWVHNAKSGHMVLKAVNCAYNGKIRSNSLERSQNLHIMIKIRTYGLERSQLCIQW